MLPKHQAMSPGLLYVGGYSSPDTRLRGDGVMPAVTSCD
jgi:hypothetical protein